MGGDERKSGVRERGRRAGDGQEVSVTAGASEDGGVDSGRAGKGAGFWSRDVGTKSGLFSLIRPKVLGDDRRGSKGGNDDDNEGGGGSVDNGNDDNEGGGGSDSIDDEGSGGWSTEHCRGSVGAQLATWTNVLA